MYIEKLNIYLQDISTATTFIGNTKTILKTIGHSFKRIHRQMSNMADECKVRTIYCYCLQLLPIDALKFV